MYLKPENGIPSGWSLPFYIGHLREYPLGVIPGRHKLENEIFQSTSLYAVFRSI